MDRFRVALSSDFVRPDGTPAFPSFDLSPLDADPRIEWSYVPVKDGRIAAADMAGFDALILLAGRFDAGSFPRDGRLGLVARFGVGYDNVDVEACSANDVALVITPSGVRRPVAVAIMTFVLALSGNLLIKDRLTRAGPEGWARRGAYMGMGLIGKTLGSVGMGNIGAELFRMAAPFGMSFVAHDPFADPAAARELGVELVPLDDVFRRSDFVCVNCPLSDDTRGLVNAAQAGADEADGIPHQHRPRPDRRPGGPDRRPDRAAASPAPASTSSRTSPPTPPTPSSASRTSSSRRIPCAGPTSASPTSAPPTSGRFRR